MTQKINSSYLADCEAMLDQLGNALQDKALDYILVRPVEYHKWQAMSDKVDILRAAIHNAAESELEAEKRIANKESNHADN